MQLLRRRVALIRHHGFPDDAAKALQHLDMEGMSSEDSEGELGTRRTFRIKKLPWRSDELTLWLQRIDKLSLKNNHAEVLARRVEHRRRVASDKTSAKRSPPYGLPVNFYNPSWLESRDSRFLRRLGIHSTKLSLPKIDEYAPAAH